MKFLRTREAASVSESGRVKADRSISSYQGRRREKARRSESERRVMKDRNAGVEKVMVVEVGCVWVEDVGFEIGMTVCGEDAIVGALEVWIPI